MWQRKISSLNRAVWYILASARPDSILISSGVRVSGNECIGKEITGDIEDPTRRELDIEDSTHELYFQSSCFNECLYASGR